MKNVLCIDYFFPPLAANWRGVAFAKHLPSYGWNPIFVSAAESVSYDKDHDLLREVPDSIHAYRIGHSELPRWVELGLRAMRCNMSFPDRYNSWIAPAMDLARRVLQEHKINALYSSSPTFATACVAQALKRETGLPWVADFLDGWSVNDFLLDSLRSELWLPLRIRRIQQIKKAEKEFLNDADAVTVIHPHVKERWDQTHSIPMEKVVVITDGYEDELFDGLGETRILKNNRTITFLGSHYRQFDADVKTFLSVVEEVDPATRVLFVGRGADRFKRIGGGNTVYMSAVHRLDALRIGAGSDFVFLIMPSYAHWSPTKLYDYLRLGTPILGLVPTDSDPARLIAGVGGTVLPYEREAMKQALATAFATNQDDKKNHYQMHKSFVKQFERKEIARKMAAVFDGIAG